METCGKSRRYAAIVKVNPPKGPRKMKKFQTSIFLASIAAVALAGERAEAQIFIFDSEGRVEQIQGLEVVPDTGSQFLDVSFNSTDPFTALFGAEIPPTTPPLFLDDADGALTAANAIASALNLPEANPGGGGLLNLGETTGAVGDAFVVPFEAVDISLPLVGPLEVGFNGAGDLVPDPLTALSVDLVTTTLIPLEGDITSTAIPIATFAVSEVPFHTDVLPGLVASGIMAVGLKLGARAKKRAA